LKNDEESLRSEHVNKGDKTMSKRMKRIFVILSLVLIFSIAMASLGIAYAGGVRGLGLLGICFFFTMGVIVILAQVIPAGILFLSMIKSIFSSSRRDELPVRV
jgi:hypothetical protein